MTKCVDLQTSDFDGHSVSHHGPNKVSLLKMSQESGASVLSQEAKSEQLENLVIDEIQKYPILFNKSAKGHRNRNKRQKAYTKIGAKIKITGLYIG